MATATNDELEQLIALDIDDLEREAGFAHGFEITDPPAVAWCWAIEEELQDRIRDYLESE